MRPPSSRKGPFVMKRPFAVRLAVALLPLGLSVDSAAEPAALRRLAVVIGANRGAADRIPLRYAVTDAERFAEVLTRMGGVRPEDRVLLRDPRREAVLAAIGHTGARAREARAS